MNAPLDIPFDAAYTLATMEHTHTRIETTPDGDPTRGYAFALPKHWAYASKFGPVLDELFAPRGIGYFTNGLEAGDPVISVTVTRVPFEVPIDQWMRVTFPAEGWTPVQGAWFPGPQGLMFDLTGVRVAGDVALVRRTTARIDGISVFCLHTVCSRERWDEFKETFWVAHLTFKLTGAQGAKRMEPWLKATASAPNFETAYPRSWECEVVPPRDDGISAIHLRLLDAPEETLMAYVLVRAKRVDAHEHKERKPLSVLVENTLPMLERSGIRAAGQLRPTLEAEDPRAAAVEGWIGGVIGDGMLGTAEITLRLGFVQRADVRFTLVLCSPTHADDGLTALRAARAYEIARGALKVLP